MGQERLNNLMLLHVHNECTDLLNLAGIVNELVMESECRLRIFAKFEQLYIIHFVIYKVFHLSVFNV